MQQLELLRMRNEIIFLSLITAIFTYYILVILGLLGNSKVLIGILIVLIPLIVGKMFKVNPVAMKWLIIISGNIIIFFINIFSFSIINFVYFIFYLLLIAIYQSVKINAILSIVTLLEVISLSYIHRVSSEAIFHTQYFETFIFVILLLMSICWIQTKCMRRFFHKLNQMKLQKEEELLSQEAYLHLFFEHANDCIAVFSLDNRIIDVNPAFEEVYGWKRSECVGRTVPLVPPEKMDEAYNRYYDLLNGKSHKLIETKDMRKDGTVFDAEISVSPIYDRNGKMVAISVISRDISYKKENEQLILQSEKLKLAGEIAAGVAHEIRNPITVISGFVQMMNSDKNSPYQCYTQIIQSEIERINLITDEFLVLSKPQVEHLQEVSIDEIIQNVSDFFQLEFQNRNISFSLSINNKENNVLANKNQLKQVFINIIKNAIEAVDMHNVDGKIHFSVNRDNHHTVLITITDNGIGMSEALLQRIFEPFYTTKTNGTGLGMLITNKIIQDHGGIIDIESKENYGTTIQIKLPCI